jgi:hypothetical protein
MSQSYMTRALKARDPRFARILGRLGYATTAVAEPVDDLADLRAEYADVVGKKAYHAWDAATLLEKIAAHKAAD